MDFIKLVDVDIPRAAEPPRAAAPAEELATKRSDAYNGPYPLKSLKRIRQLFIEGVLGADETSDRTVEVLKIKLKIKSRLDGNPTVLRQIARETAQFRELIESRADYLEKRLGTRKEVVRYFSASTSSASVSTSTSTFANTRRSEPERTTQAANKDESLVKSLPYFINKKDIGAGSNKDNAIVIDDSSSSSEDDEDDGEDDVQLLEQVESYFKETDKIVQQFQDPDSRCFQFSMYKYDEKNPASAGKIVLSAHAQPPLASSKGVVQALDRELEEKTKLYRELRNKRNKELRGKKPETDDDNNQGTSQKRELAQGLRQVRIDIKRLRQKRNKKLFKDSADSAKI